MQFMAITREERKRKERERHERERDLVFLRVLCRLVEKERQDDERTH